MKEPIVLIGGGGHCKSCIEVIESEGRFEVVYISDLPEKQGEKVLEHVINLSDDQLPELLKNPHYRYLITIGQMKSAELRKKVYTFISRYGGVMPTIISSKAIVSKRAKIGAGTIVMHAAVVNADVVVGENCIINNNVNLEHDAVVGSHCHIATNAVVNGNCKIGNEVLIGSNSVILQGVSICDNSVVGAGAVVVKDIVEPGVYVGNPARKIR